MKLIYPKFYLQLCVRTRLQVPKRSPLRLRGELGSVRQVLQNVNIRRKAQHRLFSAAGRQADQFVQTRQRGAHNVTFRAQDKRIYVCVHCCI